VVTGILQALTMSEAERAQRMRQLRSIVMNNTTGRWLRNCLDDIVQPKPADAEELAALVKRGQARRGGGDRARARTAGVRPVSPQPAASVAKSTPAPPAH
jgi:hypothetical protein